MKIGYPGGVRPSGNLAQLPTSYANRGMEFEAEIEATNEYYRSEKIALIHKRPTPIKVVKMIYQPVRKIIEAYFNKKSTVDFEGVSRGLHLEFDCKECNIPSRFPLDYIEEHQIQHLLAVEEHGGIGFFLIKFMPEDVVYFVRIHQIVEWIKEPTRKSIPRKWFDENTPKVSRHGIGRWDYISLVWNAQPRH